MRQSQQCRATDNLLMLSGKVGELVLGVLPFACQHSVQIAIVHLTLKTTISACGQHLLPLSIHCPTSGNCQVPVPS